MASLNTDERWETGARIGRYEILSKIAAGGMATVFLGRAHGAAGFERLVALKLCHAHLQEDEQAVERFLAEARLAARIHHPNVVATLDVVREPTLCIAMEYVEGGSLASLIMAARDRDQRIPPPICLRIVVDLLAGLHAAHSLTGASGAPLHLVHRDVTPQNVLVGVDGVARIADFGILKAEGQPSHTAAGNVRGKLPYLAPEQFEAGAPDRRVDVYAAGVVLWEALAGARLFQGSDYDVAQQILEQPRPLLCERVPELPPEVEQVISTAMERDRERRYPSAAAFSEALEKLSVPIASTREVAAFAAELLDEQLQARRAALVHATAEITVPGRAQTAPETPNALASHERTDELPPAKTAPGSQLPTAIVPTARLATDVAKRPRAAWLALPVLALLATAVWRFMPQPAPAPTPTVQPAPPAVEPAAEVPRPVPIPPVKVEPPPVAHVETAATEAPPLHKAASTDVSRHPAPRPHHKPKPAHAGKSTSAAPARSAPFDPDSL